METLLQNFKKKTEYTKDWLSKEMATIRTGRATSAILDSILVDSYGSKVPINQIASITTEDARTLRIVPWNQDEINAIENGINEASLSLSVSVDAKGVRVSFPELTSETRSSLLRVAKSKLEEARISTKKERDEVWNEIQKKEKNSEIGEDDKFKLKDELQKMVDDSNKELEELYNKKEKEIQN